jgi:hypothetical protein
MANGEWIAELWQNKIYYTTISVLFLRGSDHSFSNDNDNVKILTLDDDLNKLFVRLSSAVAAGGEEAVSIPELKTAVEKAPRVLIAKLDTKSQDNEDIFLANKTLPRMNVEFINHRYVVAHHHYSTLKMADTSYMR